MTDIVNSNRQLRMKLVSTEARLEDMSKELSALTVSIQPKSDQSLTSSASSGDGETWLEIGDLHVKTVDELRDYEMTVLRSYNGRLLELLELFAGMKELPLKGSRDVCEM